MRSHYWSFQTLNWARPVALGDHRAGLLLLSYKLLVILPIAGFAAQLIDRARRSQRQ
jgi:hypothetical protein